MEGQDILKLVELIDHEKKEKQNQRRKKSQQKDKRSCLADGKQNVSVVVFSQQRVLGSL